ncbi:uroporphyrinogen-III C-methyltransferase [Aeromicrobium sp.]|uniref:uroporphyrinogen-III C-methyltransferase n=1 Tax=Aeromicrobium sp. TaxID=1871063 RepID=UPI002FC9A553
MDLTPGTSALVIGGDARAAGQVATLLEAGAVVTVVAPSATASIEDLADRGLITWHPREADMADVQKAGVVLTGLADRTAPDRILDSGTVTLVGGGPGDPGLVTVAGREAIEHADVIVTDRLAPLAALAWARPDTEIIDVAKIPGGRSTSQDEINQLLVEHAKSGKNVVRFKGGDNFVFGRGSEELLACLHAGIDARVIPGVSSAIAAPALAGIPVTHRGLTQGFTVISGHVPPGHPESTLDYPALAASGTTIVVLMGVRTLSAICAALADGGLDPDTPAAVIADGTLPSQRVVRATLATLDEAAAGLGAPAVAVIGEVADIEGLR